MNHRPSILLMDEDTETLEQLQTALTREGYQVRVAVDGQAALRLIETTPPDLIVSDLLLATLDGYRVWSQIRANRNLPRIPIVALSALAIPPNNEAWRPTPDAEWQLLSYNAALSKPVDVRRLVRVVKKLLHPDDAQQLPWGPSAILAIEDETLGMELAGILRDADFGVKAPATREQALHLAQATPPAALILDYRRPDEALKNLVDRVKRSVPTTPLILIVDLDQTIEPLLTELCTGFLTTPLHPLHTLNTLNDMLDMHNMRQRTRFLSEHLLSSRRSLLDAQQALQSQNEELEHINTNLREADSQRERLTSITIHDLKSPLGSILGTLNFLLTDPDLDFSEINQNLLNGAVAAGSQMLRMIETMLDRYRLESGLFEAYTEPFDVSTVIGMSTHQVEAFLILHSLDLDVSIPPDLPLAYADANVTERILENLLDNAIKYSPTSGSIKITAVPDGQFIKISVEDHGPGIPEEQQIDIFGNLKLDKNNDKSSRTGFIPALTFCRLATEAMGGRIWIESKGDVGTTFVFTLPIYNESSKEE